jgi:hypothetical protein
MVTQLPTKRGEYKVVIEIYLGDTKCFAKNAAPKMIQTNPTTKYIIPKKGFFPPNHELSDITMPFVPPNESTGKLSTILIV